MKISKPPLRDGNVLRQQAGVAVGLGLLPHQTNLEEIIRRKVSLPGCEILCKLKKNIFSEFFRDNWAKMPVEMTPIKR